MARKARTPLIRSMASRVVCIPWELSRMAYHLGRQGVDSRHGSDGCVNISSKISSFPASHAATSNGQIVESWKQGSTCGETRLSSSCALPVSWGCDNRGKAPTTFPANNYILIGRPNNRGWTDERHRASGGSLEHRRVSTRPPESDSTWKDTR